MKRITRMSPSYRNSFLLIFLLCAVSYVYSQNNGQSNNSKAGGKLKTNISKDSIPHKNEKNREDLPSYKLSTARSISTSPPLLNLNEPGREGTFRLDETDEVSIDNGGTVFVTGRGKRYKRIFDNEVNVRWFGAKGDGTTDDKEAIQNTIEYAKTLSSKNGGTYRQTVVFPAGFYYLSTPIDVSETNGIWLKGSSGRYINTGFIGNTKGAILDFSGSTMSGCEGFTFLSLGSGNNRSTIGVLFALTKRGGLNCSIKNCYFKLESSPSSNNGFGTIGIVNIRSEEFNAADCVINANTPVVISNNSDLSDTGVKKTITSTYTQILTGAGSMGVVSFTGQMSLQSFEKHQPALILNGTNTVRFDGYIGRISQSSGIEGPAILCSQSTSNLSINATIESYSEILQVNTSLQHASLDIVSANVSDVSKPLIDVSGASLIDGLNAKIHLPVLKERINRYFLYHAPVNKGNDPVKTKLINCELYCADLNSNKYIISGNLLKIADNVEFNTSEPFAKKGGVIRQNFTSKEYCGKVGSINPATVIRFTQCDRTAKETNNGGFYTIQINGIVRAGSYGSGGSCTQRFNAIITISQSQNGNLDAPASLVTLLGKSQVSPAYLDIKSIEVSTSFSNGIGSVKIKPLVTGSGIGEVVTYQGTTEILTDFFVNDTVIFK